MGGTHLLEVALGGPSAKLNEILLTGKILSGEEAFELGLVNRLVDTAEEAKSAALELASSIADHTHPVAVRTMLQTIRQRQDAGLEAALQREAFAQAVCYSRRDWGEGVHAVADRRPPQFHGYHEP
jgi:enoyl-CoA hydratase/carnithine racemase